MHVSTVTTSDGSLLEGVRRTLVESDDVLMCVAFLHGRGLHLIGDELKAHGKKARPKLLVTTTFASTSPDSLELAVDYGLDVRILNPGEGTFHPKVYLGRSGSRASAIIGSANLTGGLATNVEAAVRLQGGANDEPLARAWSWAEALWRDPRGQPFDAHLGTRFEEAFAPDLYPLLRAALPEGTTFRTLGSKRPNRVRALSAVEMVVDTESSLAKGKPGSIPAWMFNLAWDFLKLRGTLDNGQLLDELRVHRSSAVLAALARLPGVEVLPGKRIGVRLVAAR